MNFLFRPNPVGPAMTDGMFVESALSQPLSFGENLSEQFVGGLRGGSVGLITDAAQMPAEAPTQPGLVYTPPQAEAPAAPSSEPAPGVLEPGNVDLNARPVLRNEDGSISTVRSMSFGEDGREVLIPTISDDGRPLTDEQAIEAYRASGRHLGKFDTPENATSYAERLHSDQARQYGERLVPDSAEMRASLSGARRGPLAEPIPFRSESPEEFEARRKAAGALSEEEFKALPAYREGVKWDMGMTRARAEAIASDYDARKVREFYAEKRPISSIVAQFGAGFVDPTNFIPIAGPAVRAAAVARMGKIGGGAAIGAIDAVGGSALFAAASGEARSRAGQEITWQSTVSDIAISALVGSVFGGAVGAVSRYREGRATPPASAREDISARMATLARTEEARVALNDAIGSVARGESVNLSPASRGFLEGAASRASVLMQEIDARMVSALGPHRVAAADGTSIDVRPRVMEARDIITSADDGYNAALQPRQRDRAASQAQIQQIASSLDPQRLGQSAEADRGAPILGPDGMVESGNGRVLAIREAYRAGGDAAQRYRAFLREQGVDITGMREPVLIRERSTPFSDEQRQSFTVAANRPATLAFSATERAKADASNLTPDTLSLIRNTEDLSAAANTEFVRQFVRTLPATEVGALTLPNGRVSAEGLARVRNAVLAAAYDDAATVARLTETTDDSVRSISNALTSAAPSWAALRRDVADGRVPAALDVTPALLDAVKRTANIREKGTKLADYLAQQDAFDAMPETVSGFMRLFYDPAGRRASSTARIVDGLRRYVDEARKVSSDQGLDLGLKPVTARQLIERANGSAIDGTEQGGFGFEGARDGADPAGGRPVAPGSGNVDGRRPNGDAGGGGSGGLGRDASREDVTEFYAAGPERDLDTLYREIPRHQASLDDVGRQIADDVGVRFKTSGLKGKAGAAEKMARKGYRSTRQLTDLVRAGFITKTPAEADAVISALARRFDVLDEGWKEMESGYFDRKAMVRFDDGTVGEVQLWEPNLLEAKGPGGGHKLYAEARALPLGDPRRAALEAKQRELYSAAAGRADPDWRDIDGRSGNAPNLIRKSSGDMAYPLSDTSALSTSVQSSPSARMANAEAPSVTAGRRSQSTNLSSLSMGGSLLPDGGPSLEMGSARPFVNESVTLAAKKAGERYALPEDYRRVAEQFGVNPRDGSFAEAAEVAQVREEGRLSDADEAELLDAERTFELGDAYASALRAAVGCVI